MRWGISIRTLGSPTEGLHGMKKMGTGGLELGTRTNVTVYIAKQESEEVVRSQSSSKLFLAIRFGVR